MLAFLHLVVYCLHHCWHLPGSRYKGTESRGVEPCGIGIEIWIQTLLEAGGVPRATGLRLQAPLWVSSWDLSPPPLPSGLNLLMEDMVTLHLQGLISFCNTRAPPYPPWTCMLYVNSISKLEEKKKWWCQSIAKAALLAFQKVGRACCIQENFHRKGWR